MSIMSENYVMKIMLAAEENYRVFANTNFDSMTKDYWYQLSRISINTQQAAFLIANISPKAKEDYLNQEKRSLLADARMLIDTCQIESMSALEWLRWANEHSDSPPDLMKERERFELVLSTFDRNPGKQQKAELEGLQQALERERAKNQELSRRLGNTECALEAAQRGEVEARSEIVQLKLDIDKAKERASYRLLTAALLRLLEEPGRASGINQSGIKKAILMRFSEWRGLKSRNLDDMFKEANAAAKDAETQA